jgi:outer membrane protein assembly factor BamB
LSRIIYAYQNKKTMNHKFILITISFLLILVLAMDQSKTTIAQGSFETNIWELADTPWPTHKHDQQRTGRSSFHGITDSPITKWQSNIDPITASGITIGLSNKIYVRSGPATTVFDFDGNVQLDNLPGGICYSTPTQSKNGNLHYHTSYSFVSTTEDGQILWYIPFATGCHHSTANINDEGVLYIGLSGRYSAIDLANAEILWDYPVGTYSGGSTPALGPDGTVYINLSSTGEYGSLVALNPNGTVKWKTSEYGFSMHPIVGENGTIYGASRIYDKEGFNAALTAFAPNGDPIWHFYIPETVCTYVSPALGTDGTIYFGTVRNSSEAQETNFYAVNPDGTLKWSHPIYKDGYPRICSTPIVDSNNNVYFCADTGRCYAFDQDGSKLWEYLVLDNYWLRSSPVIADDGFMILPSHQGIIAITQPTDYVYLPLVIKS